MPSSPHSRPHSSPSPAMSPRSPRAAPAPPQHFPSPMPLCTCLHFLGAALHPVSQRHWEPKMGLGHFLSPEVQTCRHLQSREVRPAFPALSRHGPVSCGPHSGSPLHAFLPAWPSGSIWSLRRLSPQPRSPLPCSHWAALSRESDALSAFPPLPGPHTPGLPCSGLHLSAPLRALDCSFLPKHPTHWLLCPPCASGLPLASQLLCTLILLSGLFKCAAPQTLPQALFSFPGISL